MNYLHKYRPRGKESIEVRKSQNKGKESENSYQKLIEITVGQAHGNCIEIFRQAWLSFINRKRVNVCEHTTKMASLESL